MAAVTHTAPGSHLRGAYEGRSCGPPARGPPTTQPLQHLPSVVQGESVWWLWGTDLDSCLVSSGTSPPLEASPDQLFRFYPRENAARQPGSREERGAQGGWSPGLLAVLARGTVLAMRTIQLSGGDARPSLLPLPNWRGWDVGVSRTRLPASAWRSTCGRFRCGQEGRGGRGWPESRVFCPPGPLVRNLSQARADSPCFSAAPGACQSRGPVSSLQTPLVSIEEMRALALIKNQNRSRRQEPLRNAC